MKHDVAASSLHGALVPEHESYYFGKPAWRKGVPLLLLALTWLPALVLWKGPELLAQAPEHPAVAAAQLALEWVYARGVTLPLVITGATVLSVPLLFLFYTGLERLVVTPQVIIRGYPLLPKRRIYWADLDEVLIDHLEARFEDETTARRTLILRSRRGRYLPLRKRMRVTNRQFDGYEEVERIAVAVGVPAIAERIRREIEKSGKPVRFPLLPLRERFGAGLLILVAIVLGVGALYDPIWTSLRQVPALEMRSVVQGAPERLSALRLPNPLALPALAPLRPALVVLAVAMILLALKKLLYQQLALDRDNLYIMRRGMVRRAIPLDTLADIQILGNVMRIYAFRRETDEEPRLVWKTRRYLPNRGVFLCLARDLYDLRRAFDMTPIVPMRSLSPSEQQKTA